MSILLPRRAANGADWYNAPMRKFIRDFWQPVAMLVLLAAGLWLPSVWIAAIAGGIAIVLEESFRKVREGNWALDYIAFLALVVALSTGNLGAGAIVALMFASGRALETYASERAESSLRALVERIPKVALVRQEDGSLVTTPLADVRTGMIIVVKPHELVPLDGTLRTIAVLNEANLTGEALPVTRTTGSYVKSGCVNAGETLEMTVEGDLSSSTYMRIVTLVREARQKPARIVRLAEAANTPFTIAALALAALAYYLSGDIVRVLAVLVIATPCPLIIAAPVAFIGGLSHAARHGIIVKSPAALEVLARARTVFFDKTGTLTLGTPSLKETTVLDPDTTAAHALAIAGSIEFHSIHPLARALDAAREAAGAPLLPASSVAERIGEGIEGIVEGTRYRVAAATGAVGGITLSLSSDAREIARFRFEDTLKTEASVLMHWLSETGMRAEVLTGDSAENAQRLLGGLDIPIRARVTPEGKSSAIDAARAESTVIMVGDGLNDAPALARADVGIVFSGTENSAAIEAAAVAILGHDAGLIHELLEDARRTTMIAKQSLWTGIGLSVLGMIAAALGFIPPVEGAIIQEGIDVAVILNALRAALVNDYRPMQS